jgi:hypothetical protein
MKKNKKIKKVKKGIDTTLKNLGKSTEKVFSDIKKKDQEMNKKINKILDKKY